MKNEFMMLVFECGKDCIRIAPYVSVAVMYQVLSRNRVMSRHEKACVDAFEGKVTYGSMHTCYGSTHTELKLLSRN